MELKAPAVRLGNTEFDQIRTYAQRVTSDAAVRDTNSRWDFWLIGNEVLPELEHITHQPGVPVGRVMTGPNYSVWIFSWSQVLDDALRRLAFLQELIDHRPDDDEAMAYLHEHHAGLMPASLDEVPT